MIRLIAAASSNGVIGRGGGMPWKHIAEDRDWLLSQIRGGVVVLGRRSFEETNRPLPGAKATVVVTRNPAMVPTTTTTTTTTRWPRFNNNNTAGAEKNNNNTAGARRDKSRVSSFTYS